MSIDKELFSDLADYLGTFAEAIKQAIPEPYAEVEANQIEDTLNQLTVAELKARFAGHGVSMTTLNSLGRKTYIIHYLIDTKLAGNQIGFRWQKGEEHARN